MRSSHTPDHPPYAWMIGAAIRSLGEEGGSTEAAISRYIVANYDALPPAHDRLLPYYLNKLVTAGEFVVAAASRRYLIANDDESMFDVSQETTSRSTTPCTATPRTLGVANGGTPRSAVPPRAGKRRVSERESLVRPQDDDMVDRSGRALPKVRRGRRREKDVDSSLSLPPPPEPMEAPPPLMIKAQNNGASARRMEYVLALSVPPPEMITNGGA